MNSTNRILSVAVVLLLLVNIAMVIFMIRGKGKAPSRKGKEPFEMMVKELNMTEEQQKTYKAQRDEHFKQMKPLVDSLRSARTAFFSLVKEENVNDSTLDIYNQRIVEQQAKIDKAIFSHFKRSRSLFTPEQQPKFDEFIKKMMQRGRRDSSKNENHK
jgi:Spy/CpxP family protein refolding chaperone